MRRWRCTLVFIWVATSPLNAKTIPVVVNEAAAPRVEFGAARLVEALQGAGLDAVLVRGRKNATTQLRIIVGDVQQGDMRKLVEGTPPGREGFVLATRPGGVIAVAGGDDSGTLYGCL